MVHEYANFHHVQVSIQAGRVVFSVFTRWEKFITFQLKVCEVKICAIGPIT